MTETTSLAPPVRCLSPTESWYTGLGAYVGYVMEASGHLDVPALSAALQAIRRAYPVLAARLRSVAGRQVLVAGDDSPPEVGVRDGDIAEPLAGFDVDPHDALSAVHVVRDGDRAAVALVVHHAIADGHHGLAVLEAFWSSYTDIVEGRPADLGTRGYPDAVEKILADRGIGDYAYPDPPTGEPAAPAPADLPAFANRFVRCDVDTASLLDLGHRAKLTLNALVSAAIIRAEAAERERSISEIPYFITVDMRKRLSPPVETTAGTNVLSFVGFTAAEDTETDLLGLARAVATRLPEALDEGTSIRRTAMEIRGFLDHLTGPSTPGSVLTSNIGTIPALRSPAGLTLERFRGSLYNKVQDASLLSPVRSDSTYLYEIYSYRGRTTVEALVGDPAQHESAQRKIALIESMLTALPDVG
ncbi:acyltransferase [Saccharopolyspora hirsuta]|uniref:phthiocerol/phthiodiolone dimycocerosyl transferase family protein n=1 Tax=Saccharopolyspora hirsuta TaxID=1837 RepID=UPI0033346CEA